MSISYSRFTIAETWSLLPLRLVASSEALKFLERASLVGPMFEMSGTSIPIKNVDTSILSADRPYSPE